MLVSIVLCCASFIANEHFSTCVSTELFGFNLSVRKRPLNGECDATPLFLASKNNLYRGCGHAFSFDKQKFNAE